MSFARISLDCFSFYSNTIFCFVRFSFSCCILSSSFPKVVIIYSVFFTSSSMLLLFYVNNLISASLSAMSLTTDYTAIPWLILSMSPPSFFTSS